MKYGLAILLLWIFLPGVPHVSRLLSHETSQRSKLFTARNVDARSSPSGSRAFFHKSGLAVDAYGAFRTYHPNDRLGLDSLSHAGRKGKARR
jgi:hypothetical protein